MCGCACVCAGVCVSACVCACVCVRAHGNVPECRWWCPWKWSLRVVMSRLGAERKSIAAIKRPGGSSLVADSFPPAKTDPVCVRGCVCQWVCTWDWESVRVCVCVCARTTPSPCPPSWQTWGWPWGPWTPCAWSPAGSAGWRPQRPSPCGGRAVWTSPAGPAPWCSGLWSGGEMDRWSHADGHMLSIHHFITAIHCCTLIFTQ